MCRREYKCNMSTDNNGDEVKVCGLQAPTHPNRAKLCPDNIFIIGGVLFFVGVPLLLVCLGGCCYLRVRKCRARQEEEEYRLSREDSARYLSC